MNQKQEHKNFLEEIIKKSPGFKGNEDLIEEILKESYKRCFNILEDNSQISNKETYIKKIINSVMFETLKNSDKIRANKNNKINREIELELVNPDYATDIDGKILLRFEAPIFSEFEAPVLSDEKIKKIQSKILEIDKQDNFKNYKNIFELRFIKGLTQREIAAKLEIEENEVSKRFSEILTKVVTTLN